MYRLRLKSTAYGSYNEEKQKLDTYSTESRFDCGSLDQLMGLLQFMVATSDKELQLTISRMEEDNDE